MFYRVKNSLKIDKNRIKSNQKVVKTTLKTIGMGLTPEWQRLGSGNQARGK